MLRKVLRDIFGVSGLVQRYELIFKTLLKSDTKKNDGKKISGFESRNTLYGILISNMIIFFIFLDFGTMVVFFSILVVTTFHFFQLF